MMRRISNIVIRILNYYFLIVTIVYSCLCFSQTNSIEFQSLEINGIPFNKKVNTLFEDRLGYLWIGSDTGLYRYDGNNLVAFQYNVFDIHSISNNNINSIIEDNYNNLWLGSESYLIHYDRKSNKFTSFYKNNWSNALYKDTKGNIWAGLSNAGMVLISPQKNIVDTKFDTHFNYNDKSRLLGLKTQISAFIEDDFGRYWIGTSSGMFVMNNQNKYIKTNFNKFIKSIKLLKNNRLIALCNDGLFVLGYNKTSFQVEILEEYSNFINALTNGANLTTMTINKSNDEIWIGSTNGLFKATRNNNIYNFNYYSNEPSKGNLLNNQISTTLFDSYGNLWIGSLKGINKYIGRTSIFDFNKVNLNNSEDNLITNSILFYNPNTILVGRNDGLYKYNPKNNHLFKIESELGPINTITTNYENNKLLIGSNTVLYETEIYSPEKNKLKINKIGEFDKTIKDVIVINKNEIWVGLWNGGVKIINNSLPINKFKNEVEAKLKETHISTFLLTSNFNLWIGTRGEGIFKVDFNNEKIEAFLPSKENGISSNAILSLHEDKEQNIWIGTRGGGLNKYNKSTNTFKVYDNSNGLNSNIISAIEEDKDGNMWMSTQDGITRLDIQKEKFDSFGAEEGVKESLFGFNSSTRSTNLNQLYFGCIDGFYTIHTDNFFQKSILPSTVITGFYTLGAEKNNESQSAYNKFSEININSENPIVLPYNQNNIEINFSSLDLTKPTKNKYAYILEGLNNYWVYTNASNRNANYNDLPSGSYTFKVKSSNSDGVWNETPTQIKFTIQPPYWASNWAILIYCLLVCIMFFVGALLTRRWYRLKKNLVKETISREKDNEHHRMKMTFFTDISHELRTPLSLILGTIEKVVKEKNFTLNALSSQRIYNNTLRMNRLINQIMDIRKFDEGKLKLSISKNNIVKDISIIKNAFNDFAKIHEINYEFKYEKEEINAWYDVDILEKILFNLLSNAFKHTQNKGEIIVTAKVVSQEDDLLMTNHFQNGTYIKCSVRDNGLGISKKDLPFIFDRYYQANKNHVNQIPGTGIGMELVHKLIERHYGFITVDSEENTFTEFTFYIPIDKIRFEQKEILKKGTPLIKDFINNSEFQVIEEVSLEFESKLDSKTSSKPKMLLVEDNLELRAMIKDGLKKDFKIFEASNGAEGYDLVLSKNPKIIISDILMPVEDGLSMLKRIKDNPKTANIPVFMLTAKSENETKIESLKLGAEDHIEKPFSLEFVKWKVINALETRKDLKKKFSKVITASPSEITVESNDDKFIRKLITIIENNMDDNLLSVEFLASEVGMSRANLYRKVQSILDDTPVNFIKKIKLKRAEQLLIQNAMYISEIAYITGFNNQKYFGKCFQKEYGMSPTQYIKEHSTSV